MYSRVNKLVLIFAYVSYLVCYGQCICNSFGKVDADVELRNHRKYSKNVRGCIDPTTVPRDALKVAVRHQSVPNLKFGAFQNLEHLANAEILNCSTTTLEPGAYKNLPALDYVTVKHTLVERIPNEVFTNFPNLDTIRLDKNKIKIIDDYAFANNPKLRQLFLSDNKIDTWQNSWFANSTSIERLYFNKNLIREIPRNAFHHFTNLVKVWFEYNDISVIQPEAFKGIRQLTYLNLRHNRLTTINPNVFPLQISIDLLYIDRNQLNFLPSDIFDRVSAKEVYLDGNPWKCPCLDRIHSWINKLNAIIKSEDACKNDKVPTCVFGQIAPESCLESVDEEATRYYFETIKNVSENLPQFTNSRCVRFD